MKIRNLAFLHPVAKKDIKSQFYFLLIGLASVVFIGYIDYITSEEINLSVFYLIPISLITWVSNIWLGSLAAVVSTIIFFVADYYTAKALNLVILYWNSMVKFSFFMVIIYILTALRDSYIYEHELARIDNTTQISNGRFFMENVNKEIDRSIRYKHSLTIAYIDIDNFKAVNDKYGHITGDDILFQVAQAIKSGLRLIDLVARLGGDEFAVLFPETGKEISQVIIERMKKNIDDIILKNKWLISLSIGVVTCIGKDCTSELLIEKADTLMYGIKKSGKNNIAYQVM